MVNLLALYVSCQAGDVDDTFHEQTWCMHIMLDSSVKNEDMRA